MLPTDPAREPARPGVTGIVRPARRPAGWEAPGPRPRTPDRLDVWPEAGEDLCYLAGDFRILQRLDGHRLSVDDLVTAWYAAERAAQAPPKRVVDLGCGIGTVLLFLAWRYPDARCTGIEAQSLSASMARRSVAWNGVEDRCEVRLGDLRDASLTQDLGPADLVTGTPPYLPMGTGLLSPREQCAACRFELRGGVEAYALAASRLLAEDAPFIACASARQRARVDKAASAAGLKLTSFREVIPRHGKPSLFAVYVMRREGTGHVYQDEPPLLIRGENGRFTEAFDELRRAMGIPV
jgi:tRNA1Val (adenine37-N6)-methyltransferase